MMSDIVVGPQYADVSVDPVGTSVGMATAAAINHETVSGSALTVAQGI